MKIRFCFETGFELPLSKLLPFQNDMKILGPTEYLALRSEIEETGFSFAPHVWQSPKDEYFLLDGHQRIDCLKRMMAEEISEKELMVPVVLVDARDFREAKRKCLAGASSYGKVSLEGVAKTLDQAKIQPLKAASMFKLPEVNLLELTPQKKKVVEFSASSKPKEKKHDCPKCGHRF